MAILAITVIIPLSSYWVWASDASVQFTKENKPEKLQAISSFYPLYEFAKEVGQNKVDVHLLIPEGVEPHDWEPTIQDVHQMQNSDLVIINGLGFENWVDNLTDMNYRGIVVDTSHGIFENKIMEKNTSTGDPHIWLNPKLAKIQVQAIADSFSKLDPGNKNFYHANADNYSNRLDHLDSKIRNELNNCNRDFIAFHDAFSYFADEYDLHQHTIISSNNEHAEPSAKTLENVINTAKDLDIKIIFVENVVDTRISSVIANEIGGKILVLSPLEFGDDGDYISRMTLNLENLKEALC